MTFTEFMALHNGKYIDTDGAYGPQCMDLLHAYVSEVLGLPDPAILRAEGPKAIWNTFHGIIGSEKFEQIANTPDGVPTEGDIIIWSTGTYGHVAIFIDGDFTKLNSFDQNWPTGSPCHVQNHTYTNCMGWLRFKTDATVEVPSKTFEELVRKSTIADKVGELLDKPVNMDIIEPEIRTMIGYEDTILEQQKENRDLADQIIELQHDIETVEKEKKQLQTDVSGLTDANKAQAEELASQQQRIDDITNKLSAVSTALEALKKEAINGMSGWELIIKGIARLVGR